MNLTIFRRLNLNLKNRIKNSLDFSKYTYYIKIKQILKEKYLLKKME